MATSYTDKLRKAVHALLQHDSKAPKRVQDRVQNLMYGVPSDAYLAGLGRPVRLEDGGK